jgi:cephalosporin hydroxylase
MTIRDWLIMHQEKIVFDECRWMGVPALKNPCDAWIYQEIVYEVQPDVIVEIGSAYGGSTLYFAHLLDLIGKGIAISVDVDRARFQARNPRILEITGDSASPSVVEAVSKECTGKTVMVVQDGNHTKAGCLRDLEAYAPLVSVNSYFIVEDGIIDLFRPGDGIGKYRPGPLAAVEQFLREHPNFIVDESRERYVLTYNPRGFLKRIR